jgi:hypothetical protein
MKRRKGLYSIARWVAASAMTVALGATLTSCTVRPANDAVVVSGPEGMSAQRGTTVDYIMSDPNAFINRTITVSGDISQVYSDRTFAISGTEPDTGDLLIVSGEKVQGIPALAQQFDPARVDIVQVTGRVERFRRAEVERQLGLTLDPQIYGQYENRPAIIAEELHLTPRHGLRRHVPPGEDPVMDADALPRVDFLELHAQPGEGIQRRIMMPNVNVQQVVGPRTFWIGPTLGQRMFVFVREDRAGDATLDIVAGHQVTLMGEVRAMPPLTDAQVRDWGLNRDQARDLANQRYYFLAERVARQTTQVAPAPAPPGAAR